MIRGKRRGRHTVALRFVGTAWLSLPLMSILVTACHGRSEAQPAVTVQQEIRPQPVHVGPATITVSLSGPRGVPLAGAAVTVEADMSHPGMSPVFAPAKELSDGRYQAQLAFSMGGDWVVILHIRLPNGRTLERQIDVPGVHAN